MPFSWVPWLVIVHGALWIKGNIVICQRSRITYPEGSLQGEIDEYLRTLTEQQQPVHNGQSIAHALENLSPYPPVKTQKYSPSDSDFSETRNLPDDKITSLLWPRLFQPRTDNNDNDVHMKEPENSETVQINTKAVAFSSLQDVENEEHIGDNQQGYTNKEAEKKSPQLFQQTRSMSEAMARKSSALTTANDVSEVTKANENFGDVYFVAIVAGCCAAGIFGVISAGICFYRLQKSNKAAADVDYPAYGVTGPNKDTTSPNGDRKLAQSAQMYHYQHQKQQMIAVEKAGSAKNTSASDVDTEEENEEGEYTVYECPGLAPTGEMEVKNPLFNDDSTPMSPPVSTTKPDDMQTK